MKQADSSWSKSDTNADWLHRNVCKQTFDQWAPASGDQDVQRDRWMEENWVPAQRCTAQRLEQIFLIDTKTQAHLSTRVYHLHVLLKLPSLCRKTRSCSRKWRRFFDLTVTSFKLRNWSLMKDSRFKFKSYIFPFLGSISFIKARWNSVKIK